MFLQADRILMSNFIDLLNWTRLVVPIRGRSNAFLVCYLKIEQAQKIRTEKDALERISTDIALQVCVSQ